MDWPVTGTYTGITYSNLYCAVCNGAVDPASDGVELPPPYDRLKTLDFWWTDVYCGDDVYEKFVNSSGEETARGSDIEQIRQLLLSG